jgi:glycerophosphoryl diester phosphodiesterase
LEAFQKAISLGADMIELDVRQTKDGELAVFHDAAIGGKNILEMSFADLNAAAKTQNFLVPTLEQALDIIANKVGLQVEIKAPGYEDEAAETCLKYLKPENFSIISFEFGILKKVKNSYPQINTGLIIGTKHTRVWKMINFLIHKKRILSGVNLLSVNWRLWEAGFANLLPKQFPLTVWTADEPELITKLLKDERVTAIASNVPDLALKLRNDNN